MAKYNQNTKLGVIIKDERAKNIVVKYLGEGVLKHPLMPMIKMMTVQQALKYKDKAGFPVADIESLANELLSLE